MESGWWLLVLAPVAAYVGYLVHLYLRQDRIVYQPARVLAEHPLDHGLTCNEITVRTADGLRLGAWYLPHTQRRGTVVYFHGNGGNRADALPQLRLLHELGMASLVVDYRGYADSEGTPCEEGTHLDALAAWDYVTEVLGESPRHVVIYGYSLGGAVGARLARARTPRALIIEGAFTSVPSLARFHFPLVPFRFLIRFRYATVEHLRAVTCPVMIVHSIEDKIVPFRHGQALFEAAHAPKTFLELNGSHTRAALDNADRYKAAVDEFLRGRPS